MKHSIIIRYCIQSPYLYIAIFDMYRRSLLYACAVYAHARACMCVCVNTSVYIYAQVNLSLL